MKIGGAGDGMGHRDITEITTNEISQDEGRHQSQEVAHYQDQAVY
jgi:hypothetical protein